MYISRVFKYLVEMWFAPSAITSESSDPIAVVFTALHLQAVFLTTKVSVCPSVCPSVCHTREL